MDQCQNAVLATEHSSHPTGERERERTKRQTERGL